MKKYIFIVLSTIILVAVLLYFYDAREEVLNREYIDDKNNIHIEYPYFNDRVIDSYINNYLELNISDSTDYELFMDYDYTLVNDIVDLYIYTYKEKGNTIKKQVKNMEIDLSSSSVVLDKNIKDVLYNYDYDLYSNKLIDRNKPLVALTFDDGPNANTSRVLEILEKYNVKATFFVLGTNIKGYEDTILRMKELGMEIGNHMYSHKLMTRLTEEEITLEIKKVDDLVFDIINRYPSLIRPSYGTSNKRMLKIIDRPVIIWDIDTLDWKYHNSTRISNKILDKVSDGDIVLMHDIYSATANSLEITIPKLLDKGYQLVTVSELFYLKEKELNAGKIYGRAG